MNKPSKCIPVTEARTLQDNWVNTRAIDLERDLGYVDTREFVYSVAELEEFLAYVKGESAKSGINNPGVRIYFAAYNDATSNKATVFLAPTIGSNVDSENNYSLDPFNKNNGGWPPKIY
jgi:hypothetical protein